jgi:hypothetical protein
MLKTAECRKQPWLHHLEKVGVMIAELLAEVTSLSAK